MKLQARFIVPGEGPPIVDGAVIVGDGLIRAVGKRTEIAGTPVTDFGDAVILPGFVNAHTHLELTRLAGKVPPSADFVDWLLRLIEARNEPPLVPQVGDSISRQYPLSHGHGTDRAEAKESVELAVHTGLRQSIAAGVTAIGDITRAPQWTRPVLARSELHTVSFGEVIALGTGRGCLSERLSAAAERANPPPATASPQNQGSVGWQALHPRMRVGISPHAPYSIEPDGMRACAQAAVADSLPVCIHLAETREEEEFTRRGTGAFQRFLRKLGVWDDAVPVAGTGPVAMAEATGLLTTRTIIAHANYVSDSDIERIAGSGASVAYCPRTHAAFGHPPHRFRNMLATGVNVCIGTDSLASNPSLSVLDELRFFRNTHSDIAPETLVALGTRCGARALGIDRHVGSIAPGKCADLVVLPLPGGGTRGWETIFECSVQPTATFISGVCQ